MHRTRKLGSKAREFAQKSNYLTIKILVKNYASMRLCIFMLV